MRERPLVLAVDDEAYIRRLLTVNLAADGYDVITAASGEEALKLLEEHQPDLVILDIMMPGMDGLELLEHIRERSSVPVLMLTAKGDISCLSRALGGGADDFMTKPFSPQVLSARVRAKLRRASPPPDED